MNSKTHACWSRTGAGRRRGARSCGSNSDSDAAPRPRRQGADDRRRQDGKPVGGVAELTFNEGDEIRFRSTPTSATRSTSTATTSMKDVEAGGSVSSTSRPRSKACSRPSWRPATSRSSSSRSTREPAAAVAHALVARQDLPIPAWLFAWGASIVLIVSFVGLSPAWRKPRFEQERWRRSERGSRGR